MSRLSNRDSHRTVSLAGASLLVLVGGAAQQATAAGEGGLKVYTDPQHADADFKFQGEYAGQITRSDGTKESLGLQVRALGDGAFRTMFFAGGLPGAGWDGKTIIQKSPSTDAAVPADAKRAGDKIVVDHVYKAIVDDQRAVGQTESGGKFELQRVKRVSPTAGAKPPLGAIQLFDGTNVEQWEPEAQMTPQKLLAAGATTARKFQDFTLHAEFMISYVPQTQDIGQRPNSGVYLQQRYEIQILDSFGVTMGSHDCGVLYAQITPTINMCYPPLTWQTYDIDFAAARYDAAGKKSKCARCTVTFNGVTILNDVEIKGSTPAGIPESPAASGIHLQSHGLPVFFRNVWVVDQGMR